MQLNGTPWMAFQLLNDNNQQGSEKMMDSALHFKSTQNKANTVLNAVQRLQRVLIVEDDQALVPLMEEVLKEIIPGVEIDWVDSGEQALKLLEVGAEDE